MKGWALDGMDALPGDRADARRHPGGHPGHRQGRGRERRPPGRAPSWPWGTRPLRTRLRPSARPRRKRPWPTTNWPCECRLDSMVRDWLHLPQTRPDPAPGARALRRRAAHAAGHGRPRGPGDQPDQILVLEHNPVFTLGRNATRQDIHVADPFLRGARGGGLRHRPGRPGHLPRPRPDRGLPHLQPQGRPGGRGAPGAGAGGGHDPHRGGFRRGRPAGCRASRASGWRPRGAWRSWARWACT